MSSNGRESFSFHFEPRNKAQRDFVRLYNQSTITLALGPAGCGKTVLSCVCALTDVKAGLPRVHVRRWAADKSGLLED
jgi:phosphate starvation-inducible protein PhoH